MRIINKSCPGQILGIRKVWFECFSCPELKAPHYMQISHPYKQEFRRRNLLPALVSARRMCL
jgi:hypothetical protein